MRLLIIEPQNTEQGISKCFSLLLRFDIRYSKHLSPAPRTPQLVTRNPQRVAFTVEPLTGIIKAKPFGLGYLFSYLTYEGRLVIIFCIKSIII